MDSAGRIADPLISRVLPRLGIPVAPPITREGLAAVYGAWCDRVPWDNVQKRIAVVERRAQLAGAEPTEFFENFLRDGTGGTCWPSAGALHALLTHLGFPARRAVAAMGEERWGRQENHGTTIVRLDGEDLLVDSSILHQVPLPLRDGARNDDPGHRARALRQADQWVIWWRLHAREEEMSCVILADDVPHARYLERYEASRETGFSHALTFTKRVANGVLSVNRSRRAFRASDGSLTSEEVFDRECVLVVEGGLSAAIVARLPPDAPPRAAG